MNSLSPITVTAFVDWYAQMCIAGVAEAEEPRRKAERTLKSSVRIISRVLTKKEPSARFQVSFRLYHGWYKGFEATDNRKAVVDLVAGTDFSTLSRHPNVLFLPDVTYSDELGVALPERRHARPPIHLPNTLRQQAKHLSPVEKMVDTALATDLLSAARNGPHEWALILSQDDDMVPPAFTAEAWMKPNGGRVLIVRVRIKGKTRSSRSFLRLTNLLEEISI